MRILIACEFSGVVREQFLNKGHDVMSCDLLSSEKDGYHYKGDVLDILYEKWDMMIAHPPCTYMCNSGVRWLYTQEGRWEKLYKSIGFFNTLFNASHISKIAIENPVPHKYAREGIGRYSQIIQPFEFGHTTSKKTCLWLKGLPKLVPTHKIDKKDITFDIANIGPSKNRWKIRSTTFRGIAKAMSNQWGRQV